ncbi:hypothetical protein [Photorhabdus caribbeanensis]|uniref:hypothetical protein n=1 Tax=Photorhabdus caribbeanensis TaxID=1004165 RepID=UPI001BD1D945|nr:hypothetical protein [Photorhabdus caribbeanensis]
MKSPGRDKALSGRLPVGIRSASGRVKNISAKSDTTRLHSKAVGLSKKLLFRQGRIKKP